MKNNPRAFDALGNIAIMKFPKEFKQKEKKKLANKLLTEQKSIKTVLEKLGKIKGRLRKTPLKYLTGEKTREVLYKENGCVFRFNTDITYFSPRLSNERKELASYIKKNQTVFVMFAGIAPYSIVIAKKSRAKKVFSNEINREANKYAKLNIELNKLKEKVELVPGDIKRVAKKLNEAKQKFDVIVMPRPNLKDTFLEQAFSLSHKNTIIYYYGFGDKGKEDSFAQMIKDEAKKFNKKVKILKVKQAGETAPYKIRFRVDFIVL